MKTVSDFFPSGGLQWRIVSGDTDVSRGQGYMVDSTVAPIVLTLPPLPLEGSQVGVLDVSGSFGDNMITLARNGQNIMGIEQDMVLAEDYKAITLVFSNSTNGWRIANTTPCGSGVADWDGVPYDDPDAIGGNPTATLYPDGSIVGSTDNGSYTKWPNGNLDCHGEILTLDTAPVDSPFPIEFIAAPVMTGSSVASSSASMLNVKFTRNTLTFQGVMVLHSTNASWVPSYNANSITWLAKGRWK